MNKKKGTIIKTYLSRRKVEENTYIDTVLIWYRDGEGRKQVKCIDRPEMEYYILKDKEGPLKDTYKLYLPKEELDFHSVPSDRLVHDVAMKTGATQFYDNILCKFGKNSNKMKNVFRHNHVYGGDVHVVDFCIEKFQREYEPDTEYELHKCYFDIEVDLMPKGFTKNKDGTVGYGDFPYEDIAPCVANLITLIDGKTKDVYTFVVRNENNKSLLEFEKDITEVKEYVAGKIREEDNWKVRKCHVNFYDSEKESITAFFNKVHEINPDYMLAWNAVFDVVTMQNRLLKLVGEEIREELKERGEKVYTRQVEAMARNVVDSIMCDDRYIEHAVDGKTIVLPRKAYYIANKHLNKKRIDDFQVLDGINWLDHMLYYDVSHGANAVSDSKRLDNVAYFELGKRKLEFDEGHDIKDIGWYNFKQFYEYNVRDVLLEVLLEEQFYDIDTLQRLSEVTCTRKEKVYSNSVSIPNLFRVLADEQGFIMTANKNKSYSDFNEDPKMPGYVDYGIQFDKIYSDVREIIEADNIYKQVIGRRERMGAFVGAPNKLENSGVEVIEGYKSRYYHKLKVDFDLRALYPSINIGFNIDSSTLVGKYFIYSPLLKDNMKAKFDMEGLFKVSEKADDDGIAIGTEYVLNEETGEIEEVDKYSVESEDLGPSLADSLMSQNFTRIGEKFMFLPSVEDMVNKLKDRIKK